MSTALTSTYTDSRRAPTRAVIYTRVSRDLAGGRSVAEQEAECRAVCERNGWPVAEVLTDNDRSATRFATKDRPQYARLSEVLRPGDVLVVWEPSRAGRSMDHYVDLRRLCTDRQVMLSYSGRLFDLEDGDDRFTTGLDALLAEREAEDIRKRIKRAHRENLAQGKPHGRVPYGYKIVRDPDTGKSTGRVPDPSRAPLVAEAARRVLDGHSFGSVVRWIETQDPLGWDSAKLRRIMVNPTYAGYRTRQREGRRQARTAGDPQQGHLGADSHRRTAPRSGGVVRRAQDRPARCAGEASPDRHRAVRGVRRVRLEGARRTPQGRRQLRGLPVQVALRRAEYAGDGRCDLGCRRGHPDHARVAGRPRRGPGV
ncbi:MAG: recombinase family protein [Gordonia sp. (in: high G+C Gram-positive bacteria)]